MHSYISPRLNILLLVTGTTSTASNEIGKYYVHDHPSFCVGATILLAP